MEISKDAKSQINHFKKKSILTQASSVASFCMYVQHIFVYMQMTYSSSIPYQFYVRSLIVNTSNRIGTQKNVWIWHFLKKKKIINTCTSMSNNSNRFYMGGGVNKERIFT